MPKGGENFEFIETIFEALFSWNFPKAREKLIPQTFEVLHRLFSI